MASRIWLIQGSFQLSFPRKWESLQLSPSTDTVEDSLGINIVNENEILMKYNDGGRMRRILFVIILILFYSFLFAEWIEIDANQEKLFECRASNLEQTELHFTLDGFESETIDQDGQIYQKLSYWNEGEFAEVGKPDLPRFSRLVAIPEQGTVSFEIINLQEEILTNMNIYPRQEFQKDNQPIETRFVKDEEFYARDEVFPGEIVEIGTPAILRDFRIVNVTIDPFQYNPQTKELRIIKDIEVIVNVDGAVGENVKYNSYRKKSRAFEALYRSSIINYDEVVSENTRDDEYQNPSYLFIYPNNTSVEATLQVLTDWKHLKGFEVTSVSTAQTGTSSYSIKNYIQNAYDNWDNPPEFICLVGDAGGSYNIPTGYYSGPGDHYYTLLEGNDILADVFIGRLSFNNLFEFETIVSKILNYEKEPYMAQTNWYQHALLVGDPSSSSQSSCIITNKYIKEIIEANASYYNYYEVYSSPFVSQMNNAINNGVTYFNYRGYIGMSGWGNDDIGNLNNGFMLPVMVFLTCSTGNFEGTNDCRSEYALKAGSPTLPKGAIAAIGTATSSTHTCFNNCVSAGTFCGIFVDKIYNMGGALTKGKLYLYLSYPQNPNNWVEKKSYWNNLMGDPGMELWTGIPQELTVTYDSEVSVGTNFMEVIVKNSSGFPIEDAWVTVLQGNDEIFLTGYTDSYGIIVLPIAAESSGNVNLTVTKHNFIPHLGDFDIVQMDVFVNVFNIDIDDDNFGSSSGNNNREINPGEDIELNVSLRNFGILTANSISATITSESDLITITDDYEEFGNILPGGTAVSYDDFDFSITSNALGGAEIWLDILIEDGNGNEWNDFIDLTVEGANLSFNEYTVANDPNGILDPGETVDIIIILFNGGSVTANSIEGLLTCTNPNINIEDSLGTFGSILPGGQGINYIDRFEVQAIYQTIPGSQIPFKLQLTNAEGYNDEITFFIEVGEVTVIDPLGPDEYGYYCYDSGDITYDLAPVYSWIEIDPTYGGSGTTINLYDPGDTGDIEIINMPFSFNFYGMYYSSITVCSNGWIAPGITEQYSFMNWHIPSLLGPSPMIAPFWDDLRIGGGRVCYYYDISMHYFIVEWSHLQNDYNSAEETFQVIIYDPAYYPTPTGDAEFVFQYETINNVDVGNYSSYSIQHGQYATVGLEDHTGLMGLEYTYNNQYPTAAAQLQNGLALRFTTAGSDMQNPPIADFSQLNFQFTLLANSSESQILEISNIGEANLVFNISKDYIESQEIRTRGQGGPDNYGYHWIDSNEPDGPIYDWRDISGLGTLVSFVHNDEATPLMPIGFDFFYYGTMYSEFRINPNGWIGFGDDNTEWNNLSLPHPNAPRPAIMPFWDDLDPLQGGDVYYYSTSDSLVVWFDNVIHFPGNYTGTYDFQLILYSSGSFLFQYRDMDGDIDSATIGIQNEDATDALQIVYNGNYVEDELAVYFKRVINWLDVSPTFGYVESGQTETITLIASSEDLYEGGYLCNLLVSTNDPEANSVTIPVDLTVVSQLPDIVVSADSLDFGIVYIGNDSTKVLTVSNQGIDPLIVSNISSDTDEFTVDITGFTLQPAQSQNVNVTFTPISDELIFGILSIASNDPNNPIVEVSLSGQGLIPGVPNIVVSADSLDFGVVVVGTDSLKTLTVSNNGDTSLSVTEIYTNSDEYSVDLRSFDLEPDEFQNLTITFTPTYEGTILDTLTILSNDPDEPVVEVALQGQGFIPIPIIQVSADSLDFGIVIVGTDSLKTLTVSNNGDISLSVTEIYTNTDEYSVDLTSFDLEPDEFQNLTITFAPSYEGTILDTLTILSNDPDEPVVEVALQGQGFIPIPIIQVSADSLDFGVVIIGSDSLNTLNVTNIGTLTLSVTNIYTNTDEYSVNLIEFNLEPEENQVLEITFAPGYEGVILDTLFIESNDPIKPVYMISLQGEGAPLVNSGDGDIPLITTLGKNYPNPFNPSGAGRSPETTINFALHEPAFTRIEIFNIKGQKIKTLINEFLEARHYQIIWNGTDDSESSVASGIYLYRMSADKFSETRKMLLIK